MQVSVTNPPRCTARTREGFSCGRPASFYQTIRGHGYRCSKHKTQDCVLLTAAEVAAISDRRTRNDERTIVVRDTADAKALNARVQRLTQTPTLAVGSTTDSIGRKVTWAKVGYLDAGWYGSAEQVRSADARVTWANGSLAGEVELSLPDMRAIANVVAYALLMEWAATEVTLANRALAEALVEKALDADAKAAASRAAYVEKYGEEA